MNIFVLAGEVDFRRLERHLALSGMVASCQRVKNPYELNALLGVGLPDIVLVNAGLDGVDVREVIRATGQRSSEIPVIVIADRMKRSDADELMGSGASAIVLKEKLAALASVIERAFDEATRRHDTSVGELAARKSEERYRNVFLHATDSMFVFPLDRNGRPGPFTDANRAASLLLGYEREELLRLSPPDLADPTERESLPAKFRDLIQKKHHRVPLLMLAKDGRRIPVEISGSLFELESQPTVLGIVTDATGKQRAEAKLREANASTIAQHRRRARREVVAIAFLCVVTMFTAGYFSVPARISDWALRHHADTILDEVVVTLVFLAVSSLVFSFRRRRELALQMAERIQVESALSASQGELQSRVQQRTAELQRTNDAFRVEIAQHERTAGVLALHSAALNAAADAIMVTDRDGTIAWGNPAFAALTGYAADEFVGKRPGELLRSGFHDREFYRKLWDTILAGNAWRGEITNRRKDGTVYPDAMTITPVRNASGAITHFVAIKRDLTDQKQLQAEYLQAQKMESVGRLAGGIAHDFNNLLTIINGVLTRIVRQTLDSGLENASISSGAVREHTLRG